MLITDLEEMCSRASRTGGPEARSLSKSTSIPSDFTRLLPVRPVQNKNCVKKPCYMIYQNQYGASHLRN